jgi:hypothetical protein
MSFKHRYLKILRWYLNTEKKKKDNKKKKLKRIKRRSHIQPDQITVQMMGQLVVRRKDLRSYVVFKKVNQ